MGKYSGRRLVKRYFNLPEWIGADTIFSGAKSIKRLYSSVTTLKKEYRQESFEEALERLGLDEGQVVKRRREFLIMAIVYFAVGLGTVAYAVYGELHGYPLSAFLISLFLSVIFFTYGLRDHFWYVQMKKRKLGITFKEWSRSWIGK